MIKTYKFDYSDMEHCKHQNLHSCLRAAISYINEGQYNIDNIYFAKCSETGYEVTFELSNCPGCSEFKQYTVLHSFYFPGITIPEDGSCPNVYANSIQAKYALLNQLGFYSKKVFEPFAILDQNEPCVLNKKVPPKKLVCELAIICRYI